MKHGRITEPHAADLMAVLVDEDISASQREDDVAREIAEIDALLESIDREIAQDERTELVRVSRSMTDQVRARRARRRSDRAAVRSLPVRLSGAVPRDGEAA